MKQLQQVSYLTITAPASMAAGNAAGSTDETQICQTGNFCVFEFYKNWFHFFFLVCYRVSMHQVLMYTGRGMGEWVFEPLLTIKKLIKHFLKNTYLLEGKLNLLQAKPNQDRKQCRHELLLPVLISLINISGMFNELTKAGLWNNVHGLKCV